MLGKFTVTDNVKVYRFEIKRYVIVNGDLYCFATPRERYSFPDGYVYEIEKIYPFKIFLHPDREPAFDEINSQEVYDAINKADEEHQAKKEEEGDVVHTVFTQTPTGTVVFCYWGRRAIPTEEPKPIVSENKKSAHDILLNGIEITK